MSNYRELTPTEREQFNELREKWIANGLSTAPCDHAAAEAGVRAAYTAAGLAEPKHILWTRSPWAAVMAQAMMPDALAEGDAGRDCMVHANDHMAALAINDSGTPANKAAALRTTVDESVDPVGRMIATTFDEQRVNQWTPPADTLIRILRETRRDLRRQLYEAYRVDDAREADNAHVPVGTAVDVTRTPQVEALTAAAEISTTIATFNETAETGMEADLIDLVAGPNVATNQRRDEAEMLQSHITAMMDQLTDTDGDYVRRRLQDWWRGRIWSQFNSGYYCWIDALEAIGFNNDPIKGQIQVALNSGWWWAFHEYAILTERPTAIHRDGQNRLHSATGPAIAYADGWGVYVWNGTRVPSWVVEDPTIQKIMDETNVEVRRCGIESYGWERYIQDSGLTLLDECDDPGNPGRKLSLYNVPRQTWGADVKVLLCVNGSPRADGEYPRFGLLIPADRNLNINTALAAAAWGYGMDPERYGKLQRRS